MNIIENVDHLRVVYGKSEDYIISFYKDVINMKELKNLLDKFEGFTEEEIIRLAYCQSCLVIGNEVKIIKNNELYNYYETLDHKPITLFGVDALKYLVNQITCEETKTLLNTIFVSEIRVTTKYPYEFYRKILYRTLRIKKQYELNAPDLIKRNEQRLLQEFIDELF